MQFKTAIKPVVISIFPPKMVERRREYKTKFDSLRRELATLSKPIVNRKEHKHACRLELFRNREAKENQLCLGQWGGQAFMVWTCSMEPFAMEKRSLESYSCFLAFVPNQIAAELFVGP